MATCIPCSTTSVNVQVVNVWRNTRVIAVGGGLAELYGCFTNETVFKSSFKVSQGDAAGREVETRAAESGLATRVRDSTLLGNEHHVL